MSTEIWIDCCRRRKNSTARTCISSPACHRHSRQREIIIADEDALTEEEITRIAYSLLNEQQKKKFDQEWELCISLLHKSAGACARRFTNATGIRK